MAEGSRDHPGEVRRIRKRELNPGDIRGLLDVRGRDYVDRLRKRRSNPFGRVLEFKAMPENQAVPLHPVLSEVLVELRRRLRLNVADLSAQTIADPQQSLIRPSVP